MFEVELETGQRLCPWTPPGTEPLARLIYPMVAGICALLRVRKQGSPQRYRDTEQTSQVIDLIFFSVPLW